MTRSAGNATMRKNRHESMEKNQEQVRMRLTDAVFAGICLCGRRFIFSDGKICLYNKAIFLEGVIGFNIFNHEASDFCPH